MENRQINGILQITVGNETDRSKAESIIRILHGSTFMDFNCFVCPVGGSFDIIAETTYDDSVENVQSMIISVLTDHILREG